MCWRVSLKGEASLEAEGLQQQQTSLRALPVRPEQKTEATVEECFQHHRCTYESTGCPCSQTKNSCDLTSVIKLFTTKKDNDKKNPFCWTLYIQKHYTQFGHNSSCFEIYNIVVQLQRWIINVKHRVKVVGAHVKHRLLSLCCSEHKVNPLLWQFIHYCISDL